MAYPEKDIDPAAETGIGSDDEEGEDFTNIHMYVVK